MTTVIVLLIFFVLLAAYSYKRVRWGEKRAEFIYHWGFLMGAYVWEDAFVFSLLGIIGCSITLAAGQIKYGLLIGLIFWIVRSAGEALYWFLQQFIVPKHHPHNGNELFKSVQKIFVNISNQQFFILLQVTFQSILVLSILGLIVLLQKWSSL